MRSPSILAFLATDELAGRTLKDDFASLLRPAAKQFILWSPYLFWKTIGAWLMGQQRRLS